MAKTVLMGVCLLGPCLRYWLLWCISQLKGVLQDICNFSVAVYFIVIDHMSWTLFLVLVLPRYLNPNMYVLTLNYGKLFKLYFIKLKIKVVVHFKILFYVNWQETWHETLIFCNDDIKFIMKTNLLKHKSIKIKKKKKNFLISQLTF